MKTTEEQAKEYLRTIGIVDERLITTRETKEGVYSRPLKSILISFANKQNKSRIEHAKTAYNEMVLAYEEKLKIQDLIIHQRNEAWNENTQLQAKSKDDIEKLNTTINSLIEERRDSADKYQSEIQKLKECLKEISNQIGTGNLSLGNCQVKIMKLLKTK